MKASQAIILTESPRDAMQGWPNLIPTELKAKYLNALLKVGFETLDCGSFVSAKAVPQMADTSGVLKLIDISQTSTNLMVIVGNTRGGLAAASESKVHTIAYPYSVSGTFLKRNLNTTPDKAWQSILDLKNITDRSQKVLRVYVAMAFGNPYGDDWNDEIVVREVEKLYSEGIRDLVFSDVTGEGTAGNIERLCSEMINSFPEAKLGIHLHTKPDDWKDKVEAAWSARIRNFEGAIGGYGGCPMSGNELLGNLDTQMLVDWCRQNRIPFSLDERALVKAKLLAIEVLK